jgi:hypothetical protein
MKFILKVHSYWISSMQYNKKNLVPIFAKRLMEIKAYKRDKRKTGF